MIVAAAHVQVKQLKCPMQVLAVFIRNKEVKASHHRGANVELHDIIC